MFISSLLIDPRSSSRKSLSVSSTGILTGFFRPEKLDLLTLFVSVIMRSSSLTDEIFVARLVSSVNPVSRAWTNNP